MSNEDSVQRTLGYLERLLEEQARRHVSREEDRPTAWDAATPEGEPRAREDEPGAEAAPDGTGRQERRLDGAAPEPTPGAPRPEPSAPTTEQPAGPPEHEQTVADDETATRASSPSTGPEGREHATSERPEAHEPHDRQTQADEPDDRRAGGHEPAQRRADAQEARAPAAREPGDRAGARKPAEVAAELAKGRGDEPGLPEASAETGAELAEERSAARQAIDENETTLEMPPLQEGGLPGGPPPDELVERRSRGGNGVQPYRRLTTRLGTLLVDEGLISNGALDRALSEHQAHGERLGHYLVDEGLVREADLIRVLAKQYGVPAAELDSVDVDAEVLELVPVEMARRYLVVPVATRGDALDVAMVDPTDVVAIANLKFATGLRPQPLIATERAVLGAIRRLYKATPTEEEPEPTREDAGPRDVRRELRRMILARDQAVMDLDTDPRAAYRLAVQVDDLVEEIIALVLEHGDEGDELED